MVNVLPLSEVPAESRKEVMIDGEKAWLVIRNGVLTEIEWENGEIAWIVDDKVDFNIKDQKDAKKNFLYDLCTEKLEELEENGYRPVFSVEKKYEDQILQKGLEPRPTWIKNAWVLAGTIGIRYLNKEGNRILCVLKPGISFESKKVAPRLTGHHGYFQGVISTVKSIYPDELIMIDTETMEVIGNDGQIHSGVISKISDTARSKISGQM